MKVGEACNREVVIVDRKATIADAAKLMRTCHVGDLVVVEARPIGRIPVGISRPATEKAVVISG